MGPIRPSEGKHPAKMRKTDQGGSYRRGIRIATSDDREGHAEGSPIGAGSRKPKVGILRLL